MRMIQATFSQHVSQLGLLGRTGEKDSRQIVFDCEKVLKEYPNATIACIFQRNDGTSPYAGSVQTDGNLRKVTLTATETAIAGELQIELRAIEGDTVRKSAVFKGYIADSLEGEGDTPGSPIDDVLNRLSVVEQEAVSATSAANEAAEAAKETAEEATKAANAASSAASKAEEATADAQGKLEQIESDIADYQASYAETQAKADTAIKAAEDAAKSASATDEAVKIAEAERVKAEAARVSAESLRVKAEEGRATNEEARVSEEDARAIAEDERVKAEAIRVTNESARVDAENVRSEAELSRNNAEEARVEAEVKRVTAEAGRVSAEEERAASESARETAESQRVTAEGERVTAFNEMLGQASEIASRIKKVEDDYLTSTDKAELTDNIAKAKEEAILAIMGEAGVDEKYDTLKEIADWILSDTTASAELVTRVSNIEKDYLTSSDKTALQKSLTELEELVGELPEGVASTVVGFIQQVKDGLTAEVSARETAVAGVQANVEAEAKAREDGDSTVAASVTAEEAARKSGDSALQASVEAEATARAEADVALTTSVSTEAETRAAQDESIDPNHSTCDSFVMPHLGVPEYAIDAEKVISAWNLTHDGDYFDVLAMCEKEYKNYSTVVYYSDIQTAVNDINNDTLDNGSTTAGTTGIKVLKFVCSYSDLPSHLYMLQLLSDVVVAAELKFKTSCFIDFNGHKISGTFTSTLTKMITAMPDSYENSFIESHLIFYGVKEGSGTAFTIGSDLTSGDFIGMQLNVGCCTFIGGKHTFTGTTKVDWARHIGILHGPNGKDANGKTHYYDGNCLIRFYGVTVEDALSITPTDGFQAFYLATAYGRSQVEIDSSNIQVTNGTFTQYASPAVYISSSVDTGYASIKNTKIEVSSGSSSDQQGAYALMFVGGYLNVRNCHFRARNCGIGGNWLGCFVSNSTLEGAEHGGLYVSARMPAVQYAGISSTNYVINPYHACDRYVGTFVQDSILRKLDGTGSAHNNLYSCYFGYGMIVHCNNVTFDSYNGAYNCPAVKASNSYGNSKTKVYLSNCSLDDIRVDSGCEAILGAGIKDSVRNTTVSGTITNKPEEVYSAVIVEELGGLNSWMLDKMAETEKKINMVKDDTTTSVVKFGLDNGYLYYEEVEG